MSIDILSFLKTYENSLFAFYAMFDFILKFQKAYCNMIKFWNWKKRRNENELMLSTLEFTCLHINLKSLCLSREIARMLADDHMKRVVIVDTSNEIGGDGDVPHSGIGRARRMQVPNVNMQHNVSVELNSLPLIVAIMSTWNDKWGFFPNNF